MIPSFQLLTSFTVFSPVETPKLTLKTGTFRIEKGLVLGSKTAFPYKTRQHLTGISRPLYHLMEGMYSIENIILRTSLIKSVKERCTLW